MSFRRLRATFGVEFAHSFKRPLFIVLALILALSAFGLSSGKMQISSGDSSVGGTKAWITSEFAQTQMMTFIILLYYGFFIAIAGGLTLLRDRETKVDVLLHPTPLTPGEYVWGRFFAVTAGFLVAMLWQMAVTAFFNHVVPNASANEIRGPFSVGNYLLPVLTMGVPFLVFFTGLSMLVGEKTRNAVLVFVLPVATLLLCGFFLWTWSPSWLGFHVNQLLQVVEPSGYRWLNESYLKVDRGVQYYNHHAVPYDALCWLTRAWVVAFGLAAVFLTQRAVARSLKGEVTAKKAVRRVAASAAEPGAWGGEEALAGAGIRSLGMRSGAPSFVRGAVAVAAIELHELTRQAGLYIWIPSSCSRRSGTRFFRSAPSIPRSSSRRA